MSIIIFQAISQACLRRLGCPRFSSPQSPNRPSPFLCSGKVPPLYGKCCRWLKLQPWSRPWRCAWCFPACFGIFERLILHWCRCHEYNYGPKWCRRCLGQLKACSRRLNMSFCWEGSSGIHNVGSSASHLGIDTYWEFSKIAGSSYAQFRWEKRSDYRG